MSERNVETFHELFRAVAARDAARLVELSDPAVEWHSFFAAFLPTGEYYGHSGLSEYVGDLEEAWEGMWPTIDELQPLGDVVVGIGQVRYRGKESGVESESPAAWVVRFRDGKVLRFHAFRDPAEARAAAGISADGSVPS